MLDPLKRLTAPVVAVVLALSLSPAAGLAQKKDDRKKDKDSKSQQAEKPKEPPQGTPVLWREQNIESLDLFRGEGTQPDLSKVTFVKEDTSGTSKKYRVTDGA